MREYVKYINRRLKDKETGEYVTEDEILEVVEAGEDVRITYRPTGEDITRAVLLRLFKNREIARPRFSVQRLTQLIRG